MDRGNGTCPRVGIRKAGGHSWFGLGSSHPRVEHGSFIYLSDSDMCILLLRGIFAEMSKPLHFCSLASTSVTGSVRSHTHPAIAEPELKEGDSAWDFMSSSSQQHMIFDTNHEVGNLTVSSLFLDESSKCEKENSSVACFINGNCDCPGLVVNLYGKHRECSE